MYLTHEAHALMVPAADALGLTASEYASAAVTYFAQRGLDPVKNQEREGIVIQDKISELERVVNSLGNRLFGWLTQHEKNTAGFLKGHEKTLFTYLQAMDQNIHEHLSGQEESLLLPMFQELVLNNIEALYGRRLGEQIMLKVLGRDLKEYPAKHREFNEKRDLDVTKRWNELIEKVVPTVGPSPISAQPTPWPERTRVVSEATSPASSSASSSTF